MLFDAISVARPLIRSISWPSIALLVGVLPLTLGYMVGSGFHQPLTGLLLVPLFWGCVCDDRLVKALLVVALALGSHSAVAIFLSINDAAGTANALSGSQVYWEQARNWIKTGSDPDYDLDVWLPQHLLLFLMILLGGALSFGALPFAVGVQQVDLMNFYVGRIVTQSDHFAPALLFGWHPWSLLRGIGYTVLMFVTASLMIEQLTRHRLSTWQLHCHRATLAVTFLVGDGLAKWLLSPLVREQLFSGISLAAQ